MRNDPTNDNPVKDWPKRKPRCAICNQYNASRRIRDREQIAHMLCGACVPQFLKNMRGVASECR